MGKACQVPLLIYHFIPTRNSVLLTSPISLTPHSRKVYFHGWFRIPSAPPGSRGRGQGAVPAAAPGRRVEPRRRLAPLLPRRARPRRYASAGIRRGLWAAMAGDVKTKLSKNLLRMKVRGKEGRACGGAGSGGPGAAGPGRAGPVPMAREAPSCGWLSPATRGRPGALVRGIPLPIAGHAVNTRVFIHRPLPLGARWLLPRQDTAAAHTELLEGGGRARGLPTAGFGEGEHFHDSS